MHGATYFQASLSEYAEKKLRPLAQSRGVALPPLSDVADVPPLSARVNHNCLIVDCACGNAEFVWPNERIVMCRFCWNGKVSGKWRPVALPTDWAAIERVLKARPYPHQRNWTTETADELRAENCANGDPEEV